MESIVDIHKGEDGRPVGTVRTSDQAEGRPFSGNLEFLALVENLYLAEHSTAAPDVYDGAATNDTKSERREQ
jgi:hypothetical protein